MQHVPALLRALGARPQPLLRAAGLPDDALARPENIIPVSKALRFMVACAERTWVVQVASFDRTLDRAGTIERIEPR